MMLEFYMSDICSKIEAAGSGSLGIVDCHISDLIGQKIIKCYSLGTNAIIFKVFNGYYIMLHLSDCCSTAHIKDIDGELNELDDTRIIKAEKNTIDYSEQQGPDDEESATATFYKIQSDKGNLNISWIGESNGYYSEEVDLVFWSNEDIEQWMKENHIND